MSLTNVPLLKEVLGLDSYQDEWIQTAMFATSPLGDFVVVASGSSLVMYIKKLSSGSSKQTFQIIRTHNADSNDVITSVMYLPVKVVSQGRSQDLWHCVVVGHESGNVQIVADSGQVLVSKAFHNTKVVNIRVLRALNQPQNGLMSALSVSKLQELVIVYEGVLAVIEASVLFSTIVSNRSEAARAKSRGSDLSTAYTSNLPAKKLLMDGDHKVADVAPFAVQNLLYDQLHKMSMSKR